MSKLPTRDDRAVVRGPASTRTLTNWTPDDVAIAEALTAGGSLQRAADLCWALLGDARVRAALETRVKGLLRLPLAWDESGDGRSSGRVSRALEGGDWYASHSEAALYSLASWGILLGVGVNQRVWKMRNARWLGVHKPYDARNLRWDTQARAWRLRTDGGTELPLLPGDRRWVLYAPSCSGDPDGDERPWMYGAWRACARPFVLKYLSLGDWGHHMQLHGSGIRTADLDEQNPPSKPVRDQLCTMLSDLASDTAIIPPPGAKLRLLEATANTWKMFPEAMKSMAAELVIALTGQSSSTEVTEGQDTGATLHGKVRQDLIECDAQTLATCLRDRDLVDYAEINFGDPELAPWPRYKTEPPQNIGARGDAMLKLGAGIASLDAVAPEGKRIDRKLMFEAAGIPLEDAPKLPPTAPQPPAIPEETPPA